MLKIELFGSKELQRKLEAMPDKIVKKIVRKGMRDNLKGVLSRAKANAPVDTGFMRDSIQIKAAPRSRRFIGLDVIIGEQNYVGKSFYGAFIEFGTKIGKKNSSISENWGNQRIRPRGFIKGAYETEANRAKYGTMEDIQTMITQEWKKK